MEDFEQIKKDLAEGKIQKKKHITTILEQPPRVAKFLKAHEELRKIESTITPEMQKAESERVLRELHEPKLKYGSVVVEDGKEYYIGTYDNKTIRCPVVKHHLTRTDIQKRIDELDEFWYDWFVDRIEEHPTIIEFRQNDGWGYYVVVDESTEDDPYYELELIDGKLMKEFLDE